MVLFRFQGSCAWRIKHLTLIRSEFGTRKGFIQMAPWQEDGSFLGSQIHLKSAMTDITCDLYNQGREKGRTNRWDPRKGEKSPNLFDPNWSDQKLLKSQAEFLQSIGIITALKAGIKTQSGSESEAFHLITVVPFIIPNILRKLLQMCS